MATEKRLIDLKKALYLAEHSGLYDFDLSALETLLLDEPCITVDAVEVVHGRWEQVAEADYKCSVCGFRFTAGDPISMFPYCRCGARMDGDQGE